MNSPQIHRTQASILHSLRYAEAETFSALMQPTAHTSDTFKFHLRKLVQLGYVAKRDDGAYELTPVGKEYANSLNEQQRAVEKQPKISILMVVTTPGATGEKLYLLQKRSRHPHFGYWSEIHGRAMWGEPFEVTAKNQLKRQTGLDAEFEVHGFRRVRDFAAHNEMLLEDKLFAILKSISVSGTLTNAYSGGTNAWLTPDELKQQDKVFASTIANIDNLEAGTFYAVQDLTYTSEDY